MITVSLDQLNEMIDAKTSPQSGYGDLPDDERRAIRVEVKPLRDERNAIEKRIASYRSSHWDQPNILAHIRVNDRTDADGKRVLFVEELQSDWGQDGKKKGFARNLSTAEKARIDELRKAGKNLLDGWGGMGKLIIASKDNDAAIADRAKLQAFRDEIASIEERAGITPVAGNRGSTAVPAAPYVTKTEGWLNLALKRVIAMAVQGGYDRVAFVTGQQSAERYSLEKQVTKIEYASRESNPLPARALTVYGLRGEEVMSKNATEEELADIIGKEVAERLLQSEPKSLGGRAKFHVVSGLDLKVGGEGMIAFYDKIVPNAVKALVKKLGGGQLAAVEMGEAAKYRAIQADADGGGEVVDDRGQTVAFHDSIAEAREDARQRNGGTLGTARLEQPGFDITPAMREKVGEGLPSFSRANGGFDLPEETRTQKARRKMQDYFLRSRTVQDAIASQGGSVTEKTDFYRAEELSHGRIASLLQDFADKQVRPLMEKAVKFGIELDELSL